MPLKSSDFRTPGQYIAALMAERGWTQRTVAVVLEISESAVARFVSGKSSIDAKLALALEEVFGVPADEFLALQRSLDLAQARLITKPDPGRATRALLYGDLPVGEMIKRGWIAAENVRDPKVEGELMRFFGVNRPEDIEILPHAAKKTAVSEPATPAQLAWLYRVKHIAADMMVPKYSPEAFAAAMPKLRALMMSPEGAARVPRIMAECGVRFVLVESLTSAKIDGVCFWLNDS